MIRKLCEEWQDMKARDGRWQERREERESQDKEKSKKRREEKRRKDELEEKNEGCEDIKVGRYEMTKTTEERRRLREN